MFLHKLCIAQDLELPAFAVSHLMSGSPLRHERQHPMNVLIYIHNKMLWQQDKLNRQGRRFQRGYLGDAAKGICLSYPDMNGGDLAPFKSLLLQGT
eukprot:2058680-Amphidinium_carterae.1